MTAAGEDVSDYANALERTSDTFIWWMVPPLDTWLGVMDFWTSIRSRATSAG
ncbi:hypothetical protein [Arthrobacter sp. LFS091]|uniref:hypothetical protein n=1 Tax=Arthrobacter sp. LFS091 TaxID=3229892 RepID=UPI003A7FD103